MSVRGPGTASSDAPMERRRSAPERATHRGAMAPEQPLQLSDTWVVIPAYNEAAWIFGTIEALAAQHDRDFHVLVVDNASTDDTTAVVLAAAACLPQMYVEVLHEPQKGTGAAVDTGFRHAIAQGARYVLRTDADCLPAPGWVAAMRDGLQENDLVGGRLAHRTDDGTAPRGARWIMPVIMAIVLLVGRFRPANNRRSRGFKTRFVLAPGANLGIRAEAYLQSGGFPRTRIEDAHEDLELINRVRTISARLERRTDAVVRFSNRRTAHNGIWNSLRWYFDHSGAMESVDVR